MTTIPIALDAATLRFYERVAEHAGLPVAQVLADALFKLAGELSLEALPAGMYIVRLADANASAIKWIKK